MDIKNKMTRHGQMTGNNGAVQTMDVENIGDTLSNIRKCHTHINCIRQHHLDIITAINLTGDHPTLYCIIKHGVQQKIHTPKGLQIY